MGAAGVRPGGKEMVGLRIRGAWIHGSMSSACPLMHGSHLIFPALATPLTHLACLPVARTAVAHRLLDGPVGLPVA